MAYEWENNEYKYIRFNKTSGGTDISDSALSAWLEENADQFLEAYFDLNNVVMSGEHTITCKGRATGYQDSEASNAVTITVYAIQITATNCSYVGAPYLVDGGKPRTLTFTADTGYLLPGNVTVTNCSYTWNPFTGELVLSNATGNPTVTVASVEPRGYVSFSSPNVFSLKTNNTSKNWDGTLEYSTDTRVWNVWTGSQISAASDGTNYNLYLSGSNNTKISGTTQNSNFVFTGANISCSGNIENLLDYATVAGGSSPQMANSCFAYLFSGCSQLVAAPTLSAETLSEGCYEGMFRGCTNLIGITILPAITLARNCYSAMFENCRNLTTAPTLPATIMANSCYYRMFSGCISLTSMPTLPATTLAYACYYFMFEGCTSLVTVSALPATTLVDFCYNHMFGGCTALVTAPQIMATSVGYISCNSMFLGCTSLVNAPTLSATTIRGGGCYSHMFDNCTSLVVAPALPATSLGQGCYEGMFKGCTSLTSAPALPATTVVRDCYHEMFSGCTNLTTAPALPATTLGESCYEAMFYGCTRLTSAPMLPASAMSSGCYSQMFYGCTSLVNAPALPAITLAWQCYNQMFQNCTSLVIAPALPATSLASMCYQRMFRGCTSLSTLPALIALEMTTQCYYLMFEGCTSIKLSTSQGGEYVNEYRIPATGTGSGSASSSLGDMFSGTGGTFTGTPTLNTTYYTSNTVIPAEQVSTPTNVFVSGTTASFTAYDGATTFEFFVDGSSIGEHMVQSGYTVTINNTAALASTYYSLDNGTTWVSVSQSTTIAVNNVEQIKFKWDATGGHEVATLTCTELSINYEQSIPSYSTLIGDNYTVTQNATFVLDAYED